MFMIGIPGTEKWLAKKRSLLKNGARTVFIIFLIVGIAEMVLLIGFATTLEKINPSGFTKVWTAFNRGFGYNDATSFTQPSGR